MTTAMDPFILARLQFAANITFHILFPSISIALAWNLLFFKLRYNATREQGWMDNYFFWAKIFALCFALGIVSGITMSFQFGTNWPGFMKTVGNIAGPLLSYEILSAFFLEATFLGIMLFGYRRVSNRIHTLATFLVAFGTTLSAFWIVALNSWMHTPDGYVMVNGQAHATDWLRIVFNPSMPYRLTHMLLASGLTAAFLISGVSAYRWLQKDRSAAVGMALKTGILTAACLMPLQIFMGDMHGLNTLQYEPQKISAMEGLWQTQAGAPMVLFGLPNEKTHMNDYAIEIPKMASIILKHDPNAVVPGLDQFEDNHPPVAPVFWAFRTMVGTGLLMLATAWLSAFLIFKKKFMNNLLAMGLVGMTFSGWVATVAGWYVTEVGRQPWLVHGVLRTVDAVSAVPSTQLAGTLTGYIALYLLLIVAFIKTVFYMARKAAHKTPAVAPKPSLTPTFLPT